MEHLYNKRKSCNSKPFIGLINQALDKTNKTSATNESHIIHTSFNM